MPIQVLMPALSPTMEKGNLAKWVKKEGDMVKAGDVIAEIETDKATMEVEAVDEGTLGQILVPEGTADVAVNTPIATILAEGEDASAAKASAPVAAKKVRSEEHTSELQSRENLVCRHLLEKKKSKFGLSLNSIIALSKEAGVLINITCELISHLVLSNI